MEETLEDSKTIIQSKEISKTKMKVKRLTSVPVVQSSWYKMMNLKLKKKLKKNLTS